LTIYVVKSGDSVWAIAQRFGVSMQSITNINKLYEVPGIVVGQALVIPTRESAYRVLPGESLWSIGRKFNVSVSSIATLNQIPSPYILTPGRIIRIPQRSKNFGYLEVNAYIEPTTTETERATIDEVGRFLTYISPFSYFVRADGTLTPMEDTTIISTGRQYRNAPLMVIANFAGGTFDTDLAHTILTNDNIQQTLINNVIQTMRSKGYYGLNIDFERVLPADRQLYNNFLRKVVAALHPLNYVVSTALAPKTSEAQVGPWYEAHDYRAHGEIVDFVILMTYEWGWSGGPPLPVAPINQVRAVLDFAVSVIPRNKIMMGMPLYGYNWTLPYVQGGPFARRVSPQAAIALAHRYGANIQYDQQSQSPFFNYYDENRRNHIVWFEDARSVQAKLIMANEYGLRGVSYWVLGVSFPQNWAVLDDMFNIVKVIT
jgi:spore germination protein